MAGPDRPRDAEWPINREQSVAEADKPAVRARRNGISPILIALGGLILLLLLLWLFTGNRSSDQDKLTGASAENASATADPEKRCASKATYDLIKRELFRRAAQVRGSDQAAFDRLSAYAVVRMENPVLESENSGTGAVQCSGSLSLDLPPGVAVVGGRRTLASDLDYTVQPAADGTGSVVMLRNADAITTPLATLARAAQPAQQPVQQPNTAVIEPVPPGASVPPQAPQAPPQAPAPPQRSTATANPSFDCADARTRGEVAVCSDAGLASLDRQMAGQFSRALSNADSGERFLLERTRSRFLSYRDACRSNACIADAYRGRMREISDIMAGRWRPR